MPLTNEQLTSFNNFDFTGGLANQGIGSQVNPNQSPVPSWAKPPITPTPTGEFLNSTPNFDFSGLAVGANDAPSSGLAFSKNPAGMDIGTTQRPNGGGFDFSQAMGNFALGAQGITGLAGAISAWKQTKLLKEQLNMQKAFANRNLENSSVAYNTSALAKARGAAQLYGTTYDSPEYHSKVDELYKPVNGSKI